MKNLVSLAGFLFVYNCGIGQITERSSAEIIKPPIALESLENWPYLTTPKLNSNAQFVSYIVLNKPPGKNSVIVKDLHSDWQVEFDEAMMSNFVIGNRIVLLKSSDTLIIQTLGQETVERIGGILKYHLLDAGNAVQWILYQIRASNKELIILNLLTNKHTVISGVQSFFAGNCDKVALMTDSGDLQLLNLRSGEVSTIWHQPVSGEIVSLIFNKSDAGIAYTVKNKRSDTASISIWSYQTGGKPFELLNANTPGIDHDLYIDEHSLSKFADDELRLFVNLNKLQPPPISSNATKLDVWSYKDPKLQSEQLKEPKTRSYAHVINLDNKKIFRIEKENEKKYLFIDGSQSVYTVVSHQEGNNEEVWNKSLRPQNYIINTRTGVRTLVTKKIAFLSPSAKFALCYDDFNGDYFSYETSTGVLREITKAIPIPKDKEFDVYPHPNPRGFRGLAGWVANDSSVMIYDRYDIWMVDLFGKKPSINITKGYGRKHNLSFHLFGDDLNKAFISKQPVILSSFNRRTKENGFFSATLDGGIDPQKLFMGPFLFYVEQNQASFLFNPAPVKAANDSLYIVEKSTAKEYPNFFVTRDFKNFEQISFLHPENEVNWLTNQLINYKSLDGRATQGILFKPENFDNRKKYPLIIYYYEKYSDQLNNYQMVYPMSGPANIPWLVSQGYLVFTPDIFYKMGYPGRSAYNSIIAGTQYLSKLPFVKADRIGIYGHSFGGFETNYLVTHSKLFAAAVSSSGVSDFISGYGSIGASAGTSRQYFYETWQSRIGQTLWERPNLYIENSAVMKAYNVTTPLLMMNNRDDGIVPFSQGVEFFTGLRRLGKKVWMLQYDGKVHVINGRESLDFTQRATQFLDHYLKGEAAPVWMTRGIPAKMKGIESGLELDLKMSCGTGCKVCQKITGGK
jgi:predicted peptidase